MNAQQVLGLSTVFVLVCCCAATSATAQPATAHAVDAADLSAGAEVVPLWPDRPATQPDFDEVVIEDRMVDGQQDRVITVATPTLTVFKPEHPDPNRPAIIICPGGGYVRLAIDKEGYAVARWLNSLGVTAFVLKYRMPDAPARPGETPLPIQDITRAIRIVRADSERWDIDPHRVGVMGFSAGGHVASTAATQFDDGDASATDAIARQSARPDFAILMYPVASMGPVAHKGSRQRLLGDHPDQSQIERFSSELHVTAKTPPLFIVHARDDKTVPIQNSTQIADAAKQAGVPCELLLLNTGGHGFGLGKPGSEASQWPAKCATWLRDRGVLSPQH